MALVELEGLQLIFDEAVSKQGQNAFHLGAYDSLKVTQACNAGGLDTCAWFVKKFFEISDGEILAGQIKQCLLKHARTHNLSSWNDNLWSGKLASQFVCLLSHVRRLQREPDKLRQCLAGATRLQKTTILELVELKGKAWKKALPIATDARSARPDASTSLGGSGTVSDHSLPPSSSTGGSQEPVQQACKKARSLKEQVSDVSVDSSGWPNILSSPKKQAKLSPKAKSKAEKEAQATILEKRKGNGPRETLEQAAEAAAQSLRPASEEPRPERRPEKKPATSKKQTPPQRSTSIAAKAVSEQLVEDHGQSRPERRPPTKTKSLKQKQTLKRPANRSRSSRGRQEQECPGPERRPWSRVKKTLATEQAYLQGFDGQSWKLIVCCSAKLAASYPGGHRAIINELEKIVMNEGMTKEKMVAERNDLLKDVD